MHRLPLSANELESLVKEELEECPVSSKMENTEQTQQQNDDSWPELKAEALYGLIGNTVKVISPYSEGDPVAVLTNIITALGNQIGHDPHFKVEHSKHSLNLYIAQVGRTSKGRKGTAWYTPCYIFEKIDPQFIQSHIKSGLSSGEGLIFAVRDRVEKINKDGKIEIIDEGVADKRLLILEEEFSQVLKNGRREGSILTEVMRKGWDSGTLQTLTKNNPTKATNAHLSIIVHITQNELLRLLTETEQGNGFGNRFIWLLVKRSKIIPNPTGVPLSSLDSLISNLKEVVSFAKTITEIKRDQNAEDLWAEVYGPLSEGKPGLIGALLGRAEAQVMRVACIYAIADLTNLVRPEHLKAALALWDYSEASAKVIFGDSTGDPYEDRILMSLKEAGAKGINETDIWNLFGRHGGARVPQALNSLAREKRACSVRGLSTGGRPPTIWFHAKQAKEANKVKGGKQ